MLSVAGLVAGDRSSAATPKRTLPAVITESATGKTFTMRRTTATLRLGNRWIWTRPRVYGTAVTLGAIKYESNPGFKAWQITRRAAGTVRITAYGRPNCDGCATRARSFSVKLTLPRR